MERLRWYGIGGRPRSRNADQEARDSGTMATSLLTDIVSRSGSRRSASRKDPLERGTHDKSSRFGQRPQADDLNRNVHVFDSSPSHASRTQDVPDGDRMRNLFGSSASRKVDVLRADNTHDKVHDHHRRSASRIEHAVQADSIHGKAHDRQRSSASRIEGVAQADSIHGKTYDQPRNSAVPRGSREHTIDEGIQAALTFQPPRKRARRQSRQKCNPTDTKKAQSELGGVAGTETTENNSTIDEARSTTTNDNNEALSNDATRPAVMPTPHANHDEGQVPATAPTPTSSKPVPPAHKRKPTPASISLRCAATGKVHNEPMANSPTRRYDIQRVPDTLRVRLRMLAARDVALRGVKRVKFGSGADEERARDAVDKRKVHGPDANDQDCTETRNSQGGVDSNSKQGGDADNDESSQQRVIEKGNTMSRGNEEKEKEGLSFQARSRRSPPDSPFQTDSSAPDLPQPPQLHRKPQTAEQEAMARDVLRLYEIAQRAGAGSRRAEQSGGLDQHHVFLQNEVKAGSRQVPVPAHCDDKDAKTGPRVSAFHDDTDAKTDPLPVRVPAHCDDKDITTHPQPSYTATLHDTETKTEQRAGPSATRKQDCRSSASPAPTTAFPRSPDVTPRKPLCAAPMWSVTDLADLQSLTPLCPEVSKYGNVHVRLSRGGVARGLLLTGCDLGGSIDSDGVVQFDVPIRRGSARNSVGGSSSVKDLQTLPSVIKSEPVDDTEPLAPQPSTSRVKLESQDEVRNNDRTSFKSTLYPASPAISGTGDPHCDGILQAWTHRTPLYVFLAGRMACHEARECFCTQGNCGGLSVLPSGVPAGVKAVGVGWAFVDGVHVEDVNKVLRVKVRVVREDAQMPFWWLSDDACGQSRPKANSRLEHGASTLCPTCSCVIPHLHWSYWMCPHCGYTLHAGEFELRTLTPPPIANDVGIRMDNGRAMFDTTLVARTISISARKKKRRGAKRLSYSVGGGVKVKSEGASESESATSRLTVDHYLANGKARRKTDALLRRVLAPSTPLQRKATKRLFAISMRLCKEETLDVTGRCPPAPPLIDSPVLNPYEHPTLAASLLDAVERMERLTDTATLDMAQVILQDRKSSTTLIQPSQSIRRIAYLHLGSNAYLSISRPDPLCPRKRRQQTVLNALVGHGDVVTVNDASRESPWSVRVDCTEMCLNFICV